MSRGDRFKRRALKRGYKVDEVDEFLDRAEATLDGEPIEDPVTAADVRDVVFRTRWGGYDEWQVDLHLDRLERDLAEMEAQGGSGNLEELPQAGGGGGGGFLLESGRSDPIASVSPMGGTMNAPRGSAIPVEELGGYRPNVVPAAVLPVGPMGAAAAAAVPAPETVPEGNVYGRQNTQQQNSTMEPGMGDASHTAAATGSRDGFGDSFADLTHADTGSYSDPFAGHTPKASVAESFQSTQVGQIPTLGVDGLPLQADVPSEPERRANGNAQMGGVYTSSPHSPTSPTYGSGTQPVSPAGLVTSPIPVPSQQPGTSYGSPPESLLPKPASVPPVAMPPIVAPPVAPPPVVPPMSASSNTASMYPGRHGKADMTVEMPTFGGNLSPFTNPDKARLAALRGAFKTRRFGTGYDSSQVERFFEAVSAAMEGQGSAQVTAADFDPRQFALVQGGYFEDEVESALAELRELFSRRLG